jgi:flavin reductase (DIM6/NTAB) family NADH-FMN oxidoreductase RutF
MTAFMSLSMDPPSLLLAINRTASLLAPLEGNGRFAVNILAADQAAACQTFVSTLPGQRFGTLDWWLGWAAACGILRCHYPVPR